jgi:chromosome segregation ATPase
MMTASLTTGSIAMSLEAMLDIVRNEELYTKRLKDLKAAEDSANTAITQLTKAKDIDAALKKAQQSEATAGQRLKEADDKAKRTESEAESKAESVINEANQFKANLERELEGKKRELTDATINVTLLNQQIDAERATVTTLRSEADSLAQANEVLKAQIREKQKALAALLS